MSKSIPELVDDFVKHFLAQNEAIDHGDVSAGNRHARGINAAWDALIDQYGDAGRDGLAPLLKHPRADVRVLAAAFLLRYKTEEATRVLNEAAAADNLAAEVTLKNWRNGTWELDPG